MPLSRGEDGSSDGAGVWTENEIYLLAAQHLLVEARSDGPLAPVILDDDLYLASGEPTTEVYLFFPQLISLHLHG
ncbi:MAG: hypothetical protein RRA32_06240 [bacterium]|nr:hypothetical protein [bacterium]MDT8396028.1 hypothetical protein [bacterium]